MIEKLKRPRLIRDWKDGYIKSLVPMRNYYGEKPAGTIFKVEISGPKARLFALPCKCCGFEFSITIKGKGKFDDFEWLGYDPPFEEQPSIGKEND